MSMTFVGVVYLAFALVALYLIARAVLAYIRWGWCEVDVKKVELNVVSSSKV